MTISNELLDELLKGCKRPEDLLGEAGLMKELKIRLMERMLGAELTAHLGYDAGAEPPPEQTNRRNGVATKQVKSSDGEVPLSVPLDREGSFEPELVKKGQTHRRMHAVFGGQLRHRALALHRFHRHAETLHYERTSAVNTAVQISPAPGPHSSSAPKATQSPPVALTALCSAPTH